MDLRQWNKVDRAIFTAAAVLLLLFSYFLYDDSLLFRSVGDSDRETVGQILKAQNDVRQKNKDSFSWTPAFNTQNVKHMDSIFTGEDSEAQIKLNDGTIIRVKPNSLVTINMKQGQMQLDLKYGDLLGDVAANSNVKIKVNGEDVRLRSDNGSSVQIKKTKDGKLEMDTLHGKATVENNGIEKEVKAAVPPKITIKDIVVTKVNTTTPFDLPWKAEGNHKSFEVIVARDANFNEMLFTRQSERTRVSILEPVPAGNYQWKVVALKDDGSVWIESDVRKLTIQTAQAPQWIKPAKDGTISLRVKGNRKDAPQIPVDLEWSPSNGMPNFEVQIDRESNFSNPLHQLTTTDSNFKTPALTNGTYFIRVRAFNNANLSTDWSATRQIDLDVRVYQLEPPRLANRRIDFTPPLASSRAPASERSPQLNWSPVKDADSYVVQISKTKDFSNSVQREVTSQDFNWEKYSGGKYFFRVISKSKEGFLSPPSELGLMRIVLGTPVIDPLKPLFISSGNPNAVPTVQKVPVKWTDIPTAANYELQIDTDPKFKDPRKMIVRNPASIVEVEKPGTYHLRVKALNEDGNPVSEFSPKEDLTYSFKRQLASPSIVKPIKNLSVYLQKLAVPFLRFEWKPVEEASKYQFELSNVADFSQTIVKTESTKPRLSVRQKLPTGPVFWRVRAVSSDENFSSHWSEPREINVEKSNSQLFIE